MAENSGKAIITRPAAFFVDFDGTIKPSHTQVAQDDLKALKNMGERGWARVVATGRSLFGFAKSWQPGLELDWLIFSSGAGLCSWNHMGPGPLLNGHFFTNDQAQAAIEASFELGFGFFAFAAPPDNHHFHYHLPPAPPAGFLKRLEAFVHQCRPWPKGEHGPAKAEGHLGQLLIMTPEHKADAATQEFKRLAPGLSIIRASSPFGDGCLWLEIFPPRVSKGQAANELTKTLGLNPLWCAAAGNDYNDLDLLNWAGRPFITSDAPPEMLSLKKLGSPGESRYRVIPPAGNGGLAQAWEMILNEKQ